MAGYFPSDETSWVLLALILFYVMSSGGVQLSLPVVGAIFFVGYIVIGTATQHH
jgi:hypothetical protein